MSGATLHLSQVEWAAGAGQQEMLLLANVLLKVVAVYSMDE